MRKYIARYPFVKTTRPTYIRFIRLAGRPCVISYVFNRSFYIFFFRLRVSRHVRHATLNRLKKNDEKINRNDRRRRRGRVWHVRVRIKVTFVTFTGTTTIFSLRTHAFIRRAPQSCLDLCATKRYLARNSRKRIKRFQSDTNLVHDESIATGQSRFFFTSYDGVSEPCKDIYNAIITPESVTNVHLCPAKVPDRYALPPVRAVWPTSR